MTLGYYTDRKFSKVTTRTILSTCPDFRKKNILSSAERKDGEIDPCDLQALRGDLLWLVPCMADCGGRPPGEVEDSRIQPPSANGSRQPQTRQCVSDGWDFPGVDAFGADVCGCFRGKVLTRVRREPSALAGWILEIVSQDPKVRRAFWRNLSTERQGVRTASRESVDAYESYRGT